LFISILFIFSTGVKEGVQESITDQAPAWARGNSQSAASPASPPPPAAPSRVSKVAETSYAPPQPQIQEHDDDTPAWARGGGNTSRASGVRVDDNPFK
jgi:hypothetical protein